MSYKIDTISVHDGKLRDVAYCLDVNPPSDTAQTEEGTYAYKNVGDTPADIKRNMGSNWYYRDVFKISAGESITFVKYVRKKYDKTRKNSSNVIAHILNIQEDRVCVIKFNTHRDYCSFKKYGYKKYFPQIEGDDLNLIENLTNDNVNYLKDKYGLELFNEL